MWKTPKVVSGLAAIPIAAALIGLTAAPAAAHDYYYHRYDHPRYVDDDGGAGIAAGIFGLMAGAVIGSALAPRYYAPDYDYGPGYYHYYGPDYDYGPRVYHHWHRRWEEREERRHYR